MKIEDTPAFPISSPSGFPGYLAHRDGMSLRDYFAGQAVVGLAAYDGFVRNGDATQRFADWAYEIADAMLRARQRGEGVES